MAEHAYIGAAVPTTSCRFESAERWTTAKPILDRYASICKLEEGADVTGEATVEQ
jgi:hypothetical protein